MSARQHPRAVGAFVLGAVALLLLAIVLVSHELPSIFELGDHAVFLDAEKRTMTAQGTPRELQQSPDPKVRAFLSRGRL